MVRRLEVLMWTDWHADVRSAAAQALAGTGHGPAVHDSLLERMSHASPVVRRDAVRRLGQLGLWVVCMTLYEGRHLGAAGGVCLQCFDAVGWAAGRASGL